MVNFLKADEYPVHLAISTRPREVSCWCKGLSRSVLGKLRIGCQALLLAAWPSKRHLTTPRLIFLICRINSLERGETGPWCYLSCRGWWMCSDFLEWRMWHRQESWLGDKEAGMGYQPSEEAEGGNMPRLPSGERNHSRQLYIFPRPAY